MQDSHSCDPGFFLFFFSITCFFFPLVPVGTYHRSPLQMYSGRWTKNTYSVRTSCLFSHFSSSLPSWFLLPFSRSEHDVRAVQASKMAVVSMLKSWPGLICLCSPDNTGLTSLLSMLPLTQPQVQVQLYFSFHIVEVVAGVSTEGFAIALSLTQGMCMYSWGKSYRCAFAILWHIAWHNRVFWSHRPLLANRRRNLAQIGWAA